MYFLDKIFFFDTEHTLVSFQLRVGGGDPIKPLPRRDPLISTDSQQDLTQREIQSQEAN